MELTHLFLMKEDEQGFPDCSEKVWGLWKVPSDLWKGPSGEKAGVFIVSRGCDDL